MPENIARNMMEHEYKGLLAGLDVNFSVGRLTAGQMGAVKTVLHCLRIYNICMFISGLRSGKTTMLWYMLENFSSTFAPMGIDQLCFFNSIGNMEGQTTLSKFPDLLHRDKKMPLDKRCLYIVYEPFFDSEWRTTVEELLSQQVPVLVMGTPGIDYLSRIAGKDKQFLLSAIDKGWAITYSRYALIGQDASTNIFDPKQRRAWD